MSIEVSIRVPSRVADRVVAEVGQDAAPAVIGRWLEAVCANMLTDDLGADYAEMAATEAAGLASHQNDGTWLAELWTATLGKDGTPYPSDDR